MESDPVVRAHTLIGRIIVAWQHLDRVITAETWGPRSGAPWAGGPPGQFSDRIRDWVAGHGGPGSDNDRFADSIRRMIDKRDDLARNVVSIDVLRGKAVIFVLRTERTLQTHLERWGRRLRLPWRPAPPNPMDRETLQYSEVDLIALAAAIEGAIEEVKARSLAFRP